MPVAKCKGDFSGVEVSSLGAAYALGVSGSETARKGGELGIDGPAWASIARVLPAATAQAPGACVAVDFSLAANQTRTIRFVLTWFAPEWNAWGGNRLAETAKNAFPHWPAKPHRFTRRYARRYPDALAAARHLAATHASILERIIAWQQVVYQDRTLPRWLQDALINNLHLITECGVWAEAKPPIPQWVQSEDGLFAMNECPRGCPQIECIPCSFYGNQPLVYRSNATWSLSWR